jgi:hypothetical protein
MSKQAEKGIFTSTKILQDELAFYDENLLLNIAIVKDLGLLSLSNRPTQAFRCHQLNEIVRPSLVDISAIPQSSERLN